MFYSNLAKVCIIASLIFSSSLLAKPLNIVTITEDFASITKEIGGNKVNISALIKGSKNLHDINPKPSMVMKVKNADVLIRLGMGQDSWVDGLIQVARNKRVFQGEIGYVDASERIQKLEVPLGHIDGSMGDVHKQGNPHYWLNPENGKVIAKHVKETLVLLDPENESYYEKNYVNFVIKMDSKIGQWKQKMSGLSDMHIVTFHKIWPYFFDAFGLKSSGELEPLPGVPPTTKHLAELKETLLKKQGNKMVLSANYYPKHIGESFAKNCNTKFKYLPISVGDSNAKTYSELFDYIVEELTK